MNLRSAWQSAKVYFGIADEEWDDEYYDDDGAAADEDLQRSYSERPNVRRLEPRRRGTPEFDEIYAGDGGRAGARRATAAVRPRPGPNGNGTARAAAQVALVVPKTFNDAQQVADKLKAEVPVILNLQTAETDLAKRLIDFSSGLTYALDGSMQRVAEKVFLLTPPTVSVSAEEKARLVERGYFFNQY
jgi:cell division inhibitor SepF